MNVRRAAHFGYDVCGGDVIAGKTHEITRGFGHATAQIRLLHIPYHSTSNSLVDLMGGQIDAIFGDVVNLKPQIQTGAIKAVAVTSARRSSLLPSVPTMAEAGLPNVQIEVWYGLFAPTGTPTRR